MNIFKNCWFPFKQNLPTILYLSFVQTWLNFNYPAIIKLGSSLTLLSSAVISIVCIIVYTYVFLFPEKYAPLVNLKFLDDFPDPILYKGIFIGLLLFVFNSTYLYLWYIDYHHASDAWYVVWYAHYVITLMLMYRAVKNYKNLNN